MGAAGTADCKGIPAHLWRSPDAFSLLHADNAFCVLNLVIPAKRAASRSAGDNLTLAGFDKTRSEPDGTYPADRRTDRHSRRARHRDRRRPEELRRRLRCRRATVRLVAPKGSPSWVRLMAVAPAAANPGFQVSGNRLRLKSSWPACKACVVQLPQYMKMPLRLRRGLKPSEAALIGISHRLPLALNFIGMPLRLDLRPERSGVVKFLGRRFGLRCLLLLLLLRRLCSSLRRWLRCLRPWR